MKLILFFLFFTSLLHAQSDTVFTIRTYGFPEIEEEYEFNVYKKWKIEYLPVAGCVVNEAFEDSIQLINKVTFEQIEKTYGTDWRKRLNLDLEKAKTDHEHLLSISIIDTIVRENDQFIETIYLYGDLSKMLVSISPKQPFRNTQNNFPKLINKTSIDSTTLYRGYENPFELVYTENQSHVFMMKTQGCSFHLYEHQPLGTFNVRINSSMKTVNILLTDSLQKTVESDFKVENLDVPQVYLNNQVDGSILDLSNKNIKWEISIKRDDPVVDQTNPLVIETWEISGSTFKTMKGTGNLLPAEAINQIKIQPTGSSISFMCTVRSISDGVLRKKSATFQIR